LVSLPQRQTWQAFGLGNKAAHSHPLLLLPPLTRSSRLLVCGCRKLGLFSCSFGVDQHFALQAYYQGLLYWLQYQLQVHSHHCATLAIGSFRTSTDTYYQERIHLYDYLL